MCSNKHPTNSIFLSPYCKFRNLVFSARFMNLNQEKKSFRNLQYGLWTRLVRSICWSTLREAREAEGVPTNVLAALHNAGYRDNPLPVIVLSKLLYGLLVMQLVFIQIWMMNVFEKVVSIYFFRYDLAVKIIEFRSFRFLKFLYCFHCLFVFLVCNILIRIYNFFFMKNKWRIIRGCT